MDALIDAAIALAGRAPSAHNTQPWVVQRTDRTISVSIDPARTLPQADPTHQDTLLGLGAWVEYFTIALHHPVTVEVAGEGLGVEVLLRVIPGVQPHFRIGELTARQVDRGRLRADSAAVTRALAAFNSTTPGTSAVVLPEKTWRRLHNRTALDIARTPAALRETLDWLRLDPRHPNYRRDGLTAECLRIPRWVGQLAQRLSGDLLVGSSARWQPILARMYYSRNLRPPTRVVCTAPDTTTPAALIECGRELLRLWLLLGREGLRVSVNSEIKDNPDAAAELPAGAFAVFSAGHSTSEVPWSSRLNDPR
ncbi:hypothetical protein [Corynebacterium sp. A21]|uniref:hypothetical protein n=1 Tax=Corynebacterium sp. A21 TaxID=3457318 RepID=UPI003FD56474